jgi:uncharacterized damage-inducible protein DinB
MQGMYLSGLISHISWYRLPMELNPYAKCLDGQDPVPILFATPERLLGLTANLSTEQIEHPPAENKWSIREVIAHLADCEIVFSFRLRQALAPAPDEPHAVVQPFNQEVWSQRYAAYDLASALDLFQAARRWNLHLLSTVTEADRHRMVTHPERGTMTFWTIVETMAGHDINHLQQLERLTSNVPA